MRPVGQRPDLLDGVAGPDLGGLGHRDHLRLHVVLVADPDGGSLHPLGGELAVGSGYGDELASEEPLRGTTLVDVDMGGVGADDRLEGTEKGLEPHHVGPGSVEDEEHVGIVAEVLLEEVYGLGGHRIFAVSGGVSDVDPGHAVENGGMDAGPVVAGEGSTDIGHASPFSVCGYPVF